MRTFAFGLAFVGLSISAAAQEKLRSRTSLGTPDTGRHSTRPAPERVCKSSGFGVIQGCRNLRQG
jgi:hypothetical protein